MEDGPCPTDDPDRAARRPRHPARHDRARARPRRRAAPPRGPGQATGAAKYADDLVFPGAWYGATIRSTDAHATFAALELDPAFDWSTVVVVTAADIPGDNVVSSIKAGPADPRPDRRRDPAPRRAAGAHRRPRPGDAPGGAPCHHGRQPSRSRRSSTRSWSDHVFAAYELGVRRPRRGLRGRRPRPRGRVPGRPPGAAVHREQRDDRRADRGRRRHRPRLAPVPVLRPHRAQARPRASTTGRRGSSRRRPAAGSVARRSTRRSSGCTRRCWRARPVGRSG